MLVDGWEVVPHSLCQTGAALPSHLSQTHRALGSILTHFGTVGLGKLWGIVILIQNFDVHLRNGFFACGVPCRSKGLVTTVGSADASPGGEGRLDYGKYATIWRDQNSRFLRAMRSGL